MRTAKESDVRSPCPNPCREEDRGQQALHAARRDVDQEPVDITMLLAIVNGHEMVADRPDVPTLRELTARLDYVPSLPDELNQTAFGGSFLAAEG